MIYKLADMLYVLMSSSHYIVTPVSTNTLKEASVTVAEGKNQFGNWVMQNRRATHQFKDRQHGA